MSEGQVPGQLAPGWVDPGQMAQAWVDPRTGSSQQPPMADSDSSEVADAVAAAHTAWLAWRSLSHEHRAMALSAIADALDDDAGPLAALGDAETALGVPGSPVRLRGRRSSCACSVPPCARGRSSVSRSMTR